jgi:magnesium-transporting ATPase (P-type)
MKCHEKRSPWCVVLSGLTGIIIFLILLVILGYLASYFHNAFLIGFVSLLTNNLTLILTAGMLFIAADIFYSFRVPFSIPGPLFSGLGSLLVVSLIFIFLDFFDQFYDLGLSDKFLYTMYILYFLVFFIVIIAGFVRIFSPEMIRKDKPWETKTDYPTCPVCTSWDDVGNEIRQGIYDLFHRFREEINRK